MTFSRDFYSIDSTIDWVDNTISYRCETLLVDIKKYSLVTFEIVK